MRLRDISHARDSGQRQVIHLAKGTALECSCLWNSRLLCESQSHAFHILPTALTLFASSWGLFFQAHVTFSPGSHDLERAPACALVS